MPRTSEIPVLSLKNVGDCATIRVSACEKMKIGDYPEVEFVGVCEDGSIAAVRVPQKSADRQLERLHLTYPTAAGETLVFSRSAGKAGQKPFWDIDRADETIDASPRPTTARATPAQSTPAQSTPAQSQTAVPADEKGAALYKRLTAFTLKHITPMYTQAGVPVTMEGVAACVATQVQMASKT